MIRRGKNVSDSFASEVLEMSFVIPFTDYVE